MQIPLRIRVAWAISNWLEDLANDTQWMPEALATRLYFLSVRFWRVYNHKTNKWE